MRNETLCTGLEMPADAPSRGPAVVLIAEDDDGHAELIRMQLEGVGLVLPFLRFHDGQQLLDFLFSARERSRLSSAVLLLDIRMPKVDGIEVLSRMRSDPMLSGMPVIVFTTTDDPKAIDRCYELGCCAFIRKPTDPELLFNTLAQLGRFLQIMQVPRLGAPTGS